MWCEKREREYIWYISLKRFNEEEKREKNDTLKLHSQFKLITAHSWPNDIRTVCVRYFSSVIVSPISKHIVCFHQNLTRWNRMRQLSMYIEQCDKRYRTDSSSKMRQISLSSYIKWHFAPCSFVGEKNSIRMEGTKQRRNVKSEKRHVTRTQEVKSQPMKLKEKNARRDYGRKRRRRRQRNMRLW